MPEINGGYHEANVKFYDLSIVDDEPVVVFQTGLLGDKLSTYSQIKNDYKIVEINMRGYLFSKNKSNHDICWAFDYPLGYPMEEREVTHSEIYNYQFIVKYGKDADSSAKARKWFMNELAKESS